MTTIRRPTGDPRRRSSNKKTLLTCRNVFLLLVIFQILSLLFSALRAPSPDGKGASQQHPVGGLEFVLSEFEKGGSRLISETEKRLHVLSPDKDIGKEEDADDETDESDDDADDDESESPVAEDGRHAEDDQTPGEGDDDEANDEADDEADDKADDDEPESPAAEDDRHSEDDHTPGDEEGNDDEAEDDESEREKLPPEEGDDAVVDRGGITDGGFMLDFAYERKHPEFRTEFARQLDQDKRHVADLAQEGNLESCLYYSDKGDSPKSLLRSECLDKEVIAYNKQPFERTWCGKKIAPNAVERLNEPCKEPVHLLPVDQPPISGEGMPPIVIRNNADSKGQLEDVECDIPCKQEKGMKGSKRIIEGTDWTLTSTMDDPYSNANAKIERTAYRRDQFYSTTSFRSSVPQSFFSFDDYDLASSSALDYDSTEAAASYFADGNCKAQSTKRHKWFEGVKEHFPVASFGKCNHNTDTELNVKEPVDRMELMKKYRFSLAFEDVGEKDHITKVVWEALQAGTVPVVVGAPNILDHVPSNSVITTTRFQNGYEDLGKYLKEVSDNKDLWESFQAWRSKPEELKAFQDRYEFTRTSASCRTCRWAYAKKYGLGWNHTRQCSIENGISRSLCIVSDKNVARRPFREVWATVKDGDVQVEAGAEASEECVAASSADATVEVDGYSVSRAVVGHDSVVDLTIIAIAVDSTGGNLVLRLATDVKNLEGSHFRNPHSSIAAVHTPLATSISIQDVRSRVTVLANWDTIISSPEEGIIEILVQESDGESIAEDSTRKIRVVVEDVDTLNDKMTEFFPSSFLKMMASDFIDPLLLFTVDSR